MKRRISSILLILFIVTVLSFNIFGQQLREKLSPTVNFIYPEQITYDRKFYWQIPKQALYLTDAGAQIFVVNAIKGITREQAYYVITKTPSAIIYISDDCVLVKSSELQANDMIVINSDKKLMMVCM